MRCLRIIVLVRRRSLSYSLDELNTMSKKACLFSVGCFILGVALGAGLTYVVATIHYGKAAARALLTVEHIRLMQAPHANLAVVMRCDFALTVR
jgi:hypothetical protein